jgi:hypothetical protein
MRFPTYLTTPAYLACANLPLDYARILGAVSGPSRYDDVHHRGRSPAFSGRGSRG